MRNVLDAQLGLHLHNAELLHRDSIASRTDFYKSHKQTAGP